MATVSKRRSYIELMIERHHDINVNSDPGNNTDTNTTDSNAVVLAKKPKHRWCWLRRPSSSSALGSTTRFEIKLSFTVQGVHSFLLKTQRTVETHNILHNGEAYRSATLDPTQSGTAWRAEISGALAGVVPPQLVDSTAGKLQRDLAGLRLPAAKSRMATRLVVVHVHVGVRVVTPDGVTPETLLNRVSAVWKRRAEVDEEEDCVICLEGFDDGEGSMARRMLVCSHVFHGECLLRWLLKRASCPVCWSRCLGLFFPRE